MIEKGCLDGVAKKVLEDNNVLFVEVEPGTLQNHRIQDIHMVRRLATEGVDAAVKKIKKDEAVPFSIT